MYKLDEDDDDDDDDDEEEEEDDEDEDEDEDEEEEEEENENENDNDNEDKDEDEDKDENPVMVRIRMWIRMKIRMESLGMKPRTPKRRLSDCSYHGPFGVGVGGESQIKNFTVVSICILKTFWYVISKYRIYLSKYIYICVSIYIDI